MKLNSTPALAAMILAAALLLVSFVGGIGPSPASAAPAAIPTPVSVTHSGIRSSVVTFLNKAVVTGTGCGPLINIADHAKIDLQWVIDQGTTPNTTTLALRFTNDGTNLATGATVVSGNNADATDMNQFAVFGRQACVHATVANTNPVTITAIGVAK